MAFVLESGTQIVGKLNKTTIEFRAERYFCVLWPVSNTHITFWIIQEWRDLEAPAVTPAGQGTRTLRRAEGHPATLTTTAPMDLVRQAYRTEVPPLAATRPRRLMYPPTLSRAPGWADLCGPGYAHPATCRRSVDSRLVAGTVSRCLFSRKVSQTVWCRSLTV